MVQELRQSTAVVVHIGSFVDVGDGFTPEVGVTLSGADEAEVLKHAATTTTSISGLTFAAITGCDGWYALSLGTGETDTLGDLEVIVQDDSVCLPVSVRFSVITANAWDSRYSTDVRQVDVTQWLGTAVAAPTVAGVPEVDVTHLGGGTQSLLDLKDFADAGYDPGTNKVQGVVLVDTTTTNTDVRGTDSAALASVCTEVRLAELDAANLPTDIDAILLDTGTDGVLLGATATSAQLVDDVWDEVLTGATHNVTNSSGRRLRQIEAGFVVASGTAQAATATTITLAAGESSTDDIFQGDRVVIIAGTGIGEHGIITAYNGTTKVATMSETWIVTPDATSEYELTPASVDIESWQHNIVTGTGDLAQVEADTAATLADTADMQPKLGSPATDVSADIAAIKAETVLILSDTNAILIDTGTTLSADIAALPTGNENADALLDRANAIETGLTLRQAQRIIAASTAGKLSGLPGGTPAIFREAVADTKARITATTDADGNRTAITYDLS